MTGIIARPPSHNRLRDYGRGGPKSNCLHREGRQGRLEVVPPADDKKVACPTGRSENRLLSNRNFPDPLRQAMEIPLLEPVPVAS